jgi:PucR family transcriptional regulator, purine catabolism regulatory protein
VQRVSVTLRQILDLDVLRRAGVRVVAGAEALDRPVRWVHIAEIADIAKLINGGELLLTTGMGIERAASAQRRYLAEIAAAGAAGLVVELGRAFGEIPPAMVHAAAQRGFPLIALERETRYIEVTEAVHRAIISDQYELLRQAEAISRDFTDLILSGADIRQIIERLAEILGNPVVLADAAQHAVELAGRGAVLALWEEHARLAHTEVERGRVHRAGGGGTGVGDVAGGTGVGGALGGPGVLGDPGREDEPKCMWVGIWLRHEEWGRVHVLETDRKLDEITGLVLDRAGAALGLALLSQKDAAHLAGRAGSALLADVLAGRQGSVAEFLRRARSLGVDLTQGRLVALVVEATSLAELARRHALAEEERQRIRLSIADEIRRAARERQCAALVGLDADRVLAIIAVTGHDPVPPILDDLVEVAARRIRAGDASLTVTAGAGREVAASSLQRALEEAVEALNFGRKAGEAPSLGRKAGDRRTVHHFAELGTYQLLVRLAQDPELARFVEAELSPLLEHDARSRAKLMPTLRSYLEHAGHKAQTVRALRVQRRTLYARLARIEQILGRDLDTQDTRTRLTLAIQALDLLQDRDSGGRVFRRSGWA